jgi:hypothetical protein
MPEAAESTSCVSPSHATAVRSHKIQSVKSRATARVEKRAFTIYHGRFLAVIPVGPLISERPPDRSVRAEFPHTAPTLGV